MTLEEKIAEIGPALSALRNYQQADMDGIFVTVSRQAVEEVVDAVEALSSLCLGVKDLEWTAPTREGDAWVAEIPGEMGFFACREYRDGWYCWFSRDEEFAHIPIIQEDGSNEFPTLEAAQQACQSDFASRWAACSSSIRTEEEVRSDIYQALAEFADQEAARPRGQFSSLDTWSANRRAWTSVAGVLRTQDQARSLQQEGKSDA